MTLEQASQALQTQQRVYTSPLDYDKRIYIQKIIAYPTGRDTADCEPDEWHEPPHCFAVLTDGKEIGIEYVHLTCPGQLEYTHVDFDSIAQSFADNAKNALIDEMERIDKGIERIKLGDTSVFDGIWKNVKPKANEPIVH